MHLKRSKIPKTWPLERKGTKYIVRPVNDLDRGIPLLIVIRDILKIVKTRRELKKLLNLKKVKVNGKNVNDEKLSLSLFDIVSLDGKNFRLVFKNKKFSVEEIKGNESQEKIVKVIGKKILKKGRIQVNLMDGRNFLTKGKIRIGDSVVVDLKENKIKEVLEFREGCKILFIRGKHLGRIGKVENIGEKRKLVEINIENEKINSRQEDLMVIK